MLALGIPAVFESIDHGESLDYGVVAAGYVVMRVAMVTQWLRAARQDPAHRRACLTYALWITLAWITRLSRMNSAG